MLRLQQIGQFADVLEGLRISEPECLRTVDRPRHGEPVHLERVFGAVHQGDVEVALDLVARERWGKSCVEPQSVADDWAAQLAPKISKIPDALPTGNRLAFSDYRRPTCLEPARGE